LKTRPPFGREVLKKGCLFQGAGRRSSQSHFKKALSSFIFNRYRYPLEKWNTKWWAVPFKQTPPAKKLSKNLFIKKNPYFLFHPASAEVSTPSIALNMSAYHPDDRIVLADKAMYWRRGLQADILKRSKGRCACCYASLVDNENTFELHHLQPKAYGGPLTKLNLLALCKECHKEVSLAVQQKDLERISYYESLRVLKGVSDIIKMRPPD
jgi:hypothetical protein